MVICYWGVCKAVEFRKLVDIFPDFTVVCMEDVGPVLMYMNPFHILCIHVSGDVWSLVNYEYRFSVFLCLVGEYGAVETGTDYKIVIHD